MLKPTLAILTALYFTATDSCALYEPFNRDAAICEADFTYKGIYTPDSLAELEGKTAPQDIYISYLTEGSSLPRDFITECELRGKLPLLVLRPTSYSSDYASRLASQLASCNKPVLLQIDSSHSDKYKDFFRATADTIHTRAPLTAMVWGISSDNIDSLTQLYPGDSYVDWVALNMFEGADRDGIKIEPYPLYHTLSYFEKSKPVMLNLSVASYTTDGHKYFATQAADEIQRIYTTAFSNPAIKAVNYISRATSKGDAKLTNSQRVLTELAQCCLLEDTGTDLPVPVNTYLYDGEPYCERGIVATTEEYKIINNKRCYKIKNPDRYRIKKESS